MKLEEFTEKLIDSGWQSTSDAQHKKISALYAELFPLEKRISELERAIEDSLDLVSCDAGDRVCRPINEIL